MAQFGYKVVNNILKSCFAQGKAQVQYFLNEWAETPAWLEHEKFTLLYFDELNDAKGFWNGGFWGTDLLFKCEVKRSKKPCSKYRCGQISLKNGLLIDTTQPWPQGTRMARQIKLLEEVAV